MAETKFTPGPWTFECQGEAGAFNYAILTAEGWGKELPWIATAQGINVGPKSLAEIEANARLIAAAPDLYEALVELMLAFGGVQSHTQQIKWDKAKTALAKAGAK